EISDRYEQLRHDLERPLLKPQQLYLQTGQIFAALKDLPRISLQSSTLLEGKSDQKNFSTSPPPQLTLNVRASQPLEALSQFIEHFEGRVLFAAETLGRRETLLDLLKGSNI